MKKRLKLFILILVAFMLVACKPGNEEITYEDITIELAEETMTFNTIDVLIHITDAIDHEDQLYEIALYVAGHVYEKHLNEIRSNRYTLTIRIHDGQSLTGTQTAYGHIVYVINQDLAHPGLKLQSENLILN